MGFGILGGGSSSSKTQSSQDDHSDNRIDNSIRDTSLNGDAGGSIFNFGQFFSSQDQTSAAQTSDNGGGDGGDSGYLSGGSDGTLGAGSDFATGPQGDSQSAVITISDASADVLAYAGDLAVYQNDALRALNDQGGDNLAASLDFAGGVVRDSNDLTADALNLNRSLARDALDFGGDSLFGALSFGDNALYSVKTLARDSMDFGANLIDGLFKYGRDTADALSKNNINAQDTVMNVAGEAIRKANETSSERTTSTAMYMAGAVALGAMLFIGMKK